MDDKLIGQEIVYFLRLRTPEKADDADLHKKQTEDLARRYSRRYPSSGRGTPPQGLPASYKLQLSPLFDAEQLARLERLQQSEIGQVL